MAEKKSTALWRAAIPLNRAWLECAVPEQRRAHEALPGWERAVGGSPDIPENAGFVDRLFSVMAAAGDAHVKKATSEIDLKSELIRRIEAGEFELLGYRVAPTKGRDPVVISDPNLTKYALNWREESLEIRDEIYLDLRVSPAELRRSGVKRGRPGSTEIILIAIDELCRAPNSDFCKISRPEACERVRELFRARGIGVDQLGNGLSDKNVAKLILRKCPKRRIKK